MINLKNNIMNYGNVTEIQEIVKTYNINELISSGYVDKVAANFGYEHLVKKAMSRQEKYNPTFYIVKAEAKWNYGLNFKIMVSYSADEINFIKEMSIGGGSITNGNLRAVSFQDNNIIYHEYIFQKGDAFRKQLRTLSNSGYIFN